MKRIFFAALALVVLASCRDQPPGGKPDELSFDKYDEALDYFMEPKYGEVRAITGQYRSHWERSELNLCSERENCTIRRNVDGSRQPCAVRFEGEALAAVLSRDLPESEFWLEGRGRIAVLPGSFGHLGSYTCQIEVSKIDRLEQNPIFQLP